VVDPFTSPANPDSTIEKYGCGETEKRWLLERARRRWQTEQIG
jgi:hypothetical protein